MCLIIFAYQSDPQSPLIVAANRDELFSRPTADASHWLDEDSGQQILSGRDLQAGCTWLGVTQNGRFAAVTNIRNPSQLEKAGQSRGDLTRAFLISDESAEQYCSTLAKSYDQFAGYNLLVGDGTALFYVNNQQRQIWRLEPGIYGLSNGLLNSSWPKVDKGRERMQALLESKQKLSTDALIAMMADRAQAEDPDLPNTGIGIDSERKLSSAFIVNSDKVYCTRCSTAVIVDQSGDTLFSEQNFDCLGNKTSGHAFLLPSA